MRQAEEEWFEANRANWNDRVAIHLSSTEYDQSKYIEDSEYISDVVSFDRERLGNIEGTRMVHLQCHIGNDTVSLARLGADVVGLDLSDKSIATAREFASAAGSNVEFFEGNVYDAPQILDRTFEFVYTSVGAINWLPDLDRWAKVVSDLLEPGGRFFIREGHPAIYPLDEQDGRLVHKYRYWSDRTTPMEWDESVSYFEGDGQIRHTKCYEWPHPLPSVINPLISNGLVIDRLEEYDSLEWQLVPMMEEIDGRFYMPGELRDKIPMMYSIEAHKAEFPTFPTQ